MVNVEVNNLERLGAYVRARRLALGLTQTQLGQRLAWTQERVSILEHGKYGMPSLPALARLAIACEVSLMDILKSAGYGDGPNIGTDGWASTRANGPVLLYTLQQLLAIEAGTMKDALDCAADLVAGVMGAEMVDAFIYDAPTGSLVALGSSNTEMGRRAHEVGMDRLPVANHGREVSVYETGEPYLTGDANHDPRMLIGMTEGLGISSFLGVPLSVGRARRGVLIAVSSQLDQFHDDDIPFFETVARWVGMVAHHAELIEEVQRDAVEKAHRTGVEEVISFLERDSTFHLEPLMERLDILRHRALHNGDEDGARELELVQERTGQIKRALNELMDASALQRGLVPLKLETTDVVELVREVADEHRAALATVHVRAPEGLRVQLDAARIRQAVDALIRNALRRSPRSLPVVVTVNVVREKDGDRVVVSVQDERTSLCSDQPPELAGDFFAVEDSPTLGMSLFQARSAVEAHGGMVSVDTPSVTTAVFKLTLPLTAKEISRAN